MSIKRTKTLSTKRTLIVALYTYKKDGGKRMYEDILREERAG